MTATREQIRAFRAMLNKLNMQDMKDDLVMQASNGRTTHSTELTMSEMRGLLEHLGGKQDKEALLKRSNMMRRRIFSMCYTLGWVKYDEAEKRDVVDKDRLDGWLIKYGYLHKDLQQYEYRELPRLVTQFENFMKSTL